MKYKQFIIGFSLAVILLVGAFFVIQYKNKQLQETYDKGKLDGLLYTQSTGNIAYLDNGTIQEESVTNICNNLLQQQLNNQEVN